MTSVTRTVKVLVKETGVYTYATYAQNRLGNWKYWVDGKFYTDKLFNKLFSII